VKNKFHAEVGRWVTISDVTNYTGRLAWHVDGGTLGLRTRSKSGLLFPFNELQGCMEAGIRISVYCLTLWLLQDCIGRMCVEKLKDHCRIAVPCSALRYLFSWQWGKYLRGDRPPFVDYELSLPSSAA
jgi:hypothetical protein